jgi:endoglucanase
MERREFIKSTAVTALGLGLLGSDLFAQSKKANPLPQWRGFNILDFFSPDPKERINDTTEEHFKWMRDWGFDFVRIPIAYPSYISFDRSRDIKKDEVYNIDKAGVERIEKIIYLAHKQKMHVSINLHRAPGYCINAGFNEPFNLWKDQEALDAFCFHWSMWAKKYKNVSRKKISFDLVNEPAMRENMNDQHSKITTLPGDVYRKVAAAAAKVIRNENPNHLIVADGNDGGGSVTPELIDLNIAQSCRGYYPFQISHYKAPWANKDPDNLPKPVWNGKLGDWELNRKVLEDYYKPWIELSKQGVGVHCGESGCWNKTPHDVFLAWFNDVLDVLTPHKIGFGIWNFIGDFGILDSGRGDVEYENWYGHKLDRKFLKLLMKYN